jgi:hypothetical protein
MLSRCARPETDSDPRHCLRMVAHSGNGQPRTCRLAPSSAQNTAYRRLALAIFGLDVASLADRLRSDSTSASRPVVLTPTATGDVPRLSATAALAIRSA